MWPYTLAVGLVSAAALIYEIILTRLLSITQWHHFAHAIISLALLGFGASGSALFLLRRCCSRHFRSWFAGSVLGFSVTSLVCLWLSQHVPFNPFMLLWDPREWLHLGLYYALLSVPFLFAGAAIGLALMQFRTSTGRIYAADLIGAGCGALGSIGLLYLVSPLQAAACVAALGFVASLIACLPTRWWWRLSSLLAGIVVLIGIVPQLALNISPYKELVPALEYPSAQILDTHSSPLGLLHLFDSPALHHAPGLSLTYQDALPRQRGIFVDGGSMSPIAEFGRDFPSYLGNMTSSLSYQLLREPEVLVLGAGGGTDVLAALAHGAQQVDAVELNGKVVDWVRQSPEFSGGIYDPQQYPVRIFVAEARSFVETSRDTYDLIVLTLLDSVSAASAGVYALSESYLYTVEAMRAYLKHLKPGGMLAITRWAKLPPRDSLKLFATATQACGPTGTGQIAMIRSWRTVTLLIKNGAYTEADLAQIRSFCSTRSFDLVYLPGMQAEEANRYHQLQQPEYYQACQRLASTEREAFLAQYPFHIEPATDTRPYFFHFFRWRHLDTLRQRSGTAWFPVEEWGYLLLIATLAQAVVLGFVLVIVPLFVERQRHMNGWMLLYFLLLGVGFMFVEVVFIQRLVLFLGHPTYAVAVALAGFLLFAGLGSALSPRFQGVRFAVSAILFLGLLYSLSLGSLFRPLMGLPAAWKVTISLMIIAPLAVSMGMPFPIGIRRIAGHAPQAIAWAWAINGCASVISAVLAVCIAMSVGFTGVITLALLSYLIALWAFQRLS